MVSKQLSIGQKTQEFLMGKGVNDFKSVQGKSSYTYNHMIVLFAIVYTLFQLPSIIKHYKKVPSTLQAMYWATLIVFAIQFVIVLYLLPNIVECAIVGKCQKIAWFLFAIGFVMAVEKIFMYIYTLNALQTF